MTQPNPKIVVLKFGGTSVEDAAAITRTASIVAGRHARHLQPVVVVSAMARVTDQLVAAADAAGRDQRREAIALSVRLRERHLSTAAALVPAHGIEPLAIALHHEFDALDDLLRGIAAVGELTPRTNDLVLSFGERASSLIVTAAFTALGLPAHHVDARHCIVTDSHYGKAAPNEPAIERALHTLVLPVLISGQVPVMGGFIGSNPEGITTTLGRGGSDYTAALVGGGLHAGAIEIWTDVNGIMTTDPRIVPEALRVKTISFEEAAELAYFGAKVLHPATILPAVQKSIPVFVLNSRNAVQRRHPHHRHRRALRLAFQVHRRQKAPHHHRHRRLPHAHGARLSRLRLRRLRPLPGAPSTWSQPPKSPSRLPSIRTTACPPSATSSRKLPTSSTKAARPSYAWSAKTSAATTASRAASSPPSRTSTYA